MGPNPNLTGDGEYNISILMPRLVNMYAMTIEPLTKVHSVAGSKWVRGWRDKNTANEQPTIAPAVISTPRIR